VEEGDDFLLEEISLAAQDFGLPEFTWPGEPLSPLSPTGEMRVGSEPSQESPPTPDARKETTEELEVLSPDIRAEDVTSGAEVDPQGERPEQRTPLDPSADAAAGGPSGEAPVPSTSGAGFDFLGTRLLGDPLEALASVLPNGLFQDVGRTTPFKFAQGIIESQIAVPSSCCLSSFLSSSFLGRFSPSFSIQDSLRSVAAWSNFLEHMRANPDIEATLRPKISRLEHTVVSQDEVIVGLTQ
jgi:hypothetical protein